MPLPKVKEGESEKEFISRCARAIADEFPDNAQRIAVCYSQLRQKMSEEEMFVLQPKKNENRGTYLSRCSKNGKMRTQFPNMKERMGYCLNSFNSYYKYWAKLDEFGEVPKDSALGLCIAKEKARGLGYQEAYQRCATKSISPNVPIVLGEDGLIVEPVEFAEMNILGYNTKYFEMCPGAQATFKNLMLSPIDDETAGMIRSAAQIADNVFGIEKMVIDDESATQEQLDEAKILVQDFYDVMSEIVEETGISQDVSYMEGHLQKISSYLD